MTTDDDASEIYVADGYGNRRVVVFDSKTGAYKRHWGAYGTKTPHDDKLANYDPKAELSKSFGNPEHCVRLSNDGLVYVCDQTNNRIQVFRKDGSFVKEFRVEKETLQNSSVWDLVLSEDPQQRFIFMADGTNGQIVTLLRDSGDAVAQWGRHGRQPGQFKWVHNIAIDSKGNDTGGIIPWSPENESKALWLADNNCRDYGKYVRITSVNRHHGKYIGYVCLFPRRRT